MLVVGITKLLSRVLGEDIEIALELSAEAWPILVDPAQLETSLTNLATNARDAMPSGGRLRIATVNRHLDADYAEQHAEVVPGDYVMIEVSDTGSGMTAEVMNRIFEPFFTTKEQGKGTGLGLSMVFGFTKQSGGHISVYSEPGIGTTLHLFLPRSKESEADPDQRSSGQLVSGGDETILVVEDNAALRRVVVRQLRELGYRVLAAENAVVALQLMEQQRIDLLLTDIIMPGGIDGVELARRARERWPTTKTVFTSGFPDARPSSSNGLLVPRAALLSKPYRKEDLASAVRQALDSQA